MRVMMNIKWNKEMIRKTAGKALCLFFAFALLFTFLSRAIDSFTIPKVTIQAAGNGKLEYRAEGSGMLESVGEEYINVMEEMKIEDIFVKEGEYIEKGTALFSYDLNPVKEKIEQLQTEKETLQTNYENEKELLSFDDSSIMKSPEERALEQAQEEYRQAQEDIKEAEQEYERKLGQIKKELTKEQEEAEKAALEKVKAAKEAYETVEKQLNDAYLAQKQSLEDINYEKGQTVQAAEEQIKEAKKEKEVLCEPLKKREQAIEEFVSASQAGTVTLQDSIVTLLKAYYGEEEYQNLLYEIEQASMSYYSAVNSYNETEGLDENARWAAKAAMKQAELSLEKLESKKNRITSAANAYKKALSSKDENNIKVYYGNLYDELTDNITVTEAQIQQAQEKIEKREEELQQIIIRQDELISRAQQQVETAKKAWQDGVLKAKEEYSEAEIAYEQILQQVYGNEEGVLAAKRELDNVKKAEEAAYKNIETANYNLEVSRDTKEIAKRKEELEEKLSLKTLQLKLKEIEEKQKQIAKLQRILNMGGTVYTPSSGNLLKLGITRKQQTTGAEEIMLDSGSYIFAAELTKEEKEIVKKGDETTLKLADEEKEKKGKVKKITYDREKNNYRVEISLPKGNYALGTTGTYSIIKNSENYDCCIPISALRSDLKGSYVLVVQESNSVLGTVQIAARINVVVTKKDHSSAAIESGIYKGDMIITDSNKSIEEGERVRVVES